MQSTLNPDYLNSTPRSPTVPSPSNHSICSSFISHPSVNHYRHGQRTHQRSHPRYHPHAMASFLPPHGRRLHRVVPDLWLWTGTGVSIHVREEDRFQEVRRGERRVG